MTFSKQLCLAFHSGFSYATPITIKETDCFDAAEAVGHLIRITAGGMHFQRGSEALCDLIYEHPACNRGAMFTKAKLMGL